MEKKKVYLVYESSKGSRDLVYCTMSAVDAFAKADEFKALSVASNPDFTRNYRVYEMPLNCCEL